jgi:hypothetical protein
MNDITVTKADIILDPNTFQPRLEIAVSLAMLPVTTASPDDEDKVALNIGKELLKQASILYALSKDSDEWQKHKL